MVRYAFGVSESGGIPTLNCIKRSAVAGAWKWLGLLVKHVVPGISARGATPQPLSTEVPVALSMMLRDTRLEYPHGVVSTWPVSEILSLVSSISAPRFQFFHYEFRLLTSL